MIGSNAVLGLLPPGTANDFARTFGIPPNLTGARQTIAQSKTVDGDSGLARANYYVKVASVVLGLRLLKPFRRG
jgi:diacylglycerol kinase family enzyme